MSIFLSYYETSKAAGQKHILVVCVQPLAKTCGRYVCFYINKVKVEFVLDDTYKRILLTDDDSRKEELSLS